MTEQEIYINAIDRLDPVERQLYLDEACNGDSALRERVEKLIRQSDQLGSFLEHSPVDASMAAASPSSDSQDSQNATLLCRDGSTEADGELPRGENTMHLNPQDNEDDMIPLGYLQPSSKPDSLGRLGHYEVLEVVGRGAFGTVLRAFDEKLQRVVAIKVLAPEMAATSPARKRFLREARTSAAIRHENVVGIYSVEEEPIPYLVMEYIPGRTLQQRLDEHGPLSVMEVLKLGKQIADGLAAAHAQDLIHRDIKPGNILLEGGVTERVKITDFGLARTADDASMTQSGLIAGTPMYMAPEQAMGHKLDQRADLFSFGSVLYQMLSGRPPFRAANTVAVLKRVVDDAPRPIQEIIPEVPTWVCEVVSHLHAKNPEDRYQSAKEVSELLGQCLDDLKAGSVPNLRSPSTGTASTEIRPTTANSSHETPRRSRPRARITAIVVCILAVIGLGVTEFAGVTHLFRPQPPVMTDRQPIANPFEEGVAATVANTSRWVPLFNGKDLTGWRPHRELPGDWRVENEALVGTGTVGPSYLLTERSDFTNFRIRAEVLVENDDDSGLVLRCGDNPISLHNGVTSMPGIEVDLLPVRASQDFQAGTLWHIGESVITETVHTRLVERNRWFTLDVVAVGNRVTVSIDNQLVVDSTANPNRAARGHLALQRSNAGTVRFRKIEIMELPPIAPSSDAPASVTASKSPQWPADAPPPAIAPFDAAQAKAHQEEWAKYLSVPVEYTNSVGMKFRLIPPGEFMMGSTLEEIESTVALIGDSDWSKQWKNCIRSEAPRHKVILTQPLYLGSTEVTQSQFEKVMGTNPSNFSATGKLKDAVAKIETGEHPVETVTWQDATEFCQKLSQREKQTPFYLRSGATVTTLNGTGYRLPSEAEWEYACRAGTTTRCWVGERDEDLKQVDWFRSPTLRTHAVGELAANPFGLYDTLGNVSEWVHDGWDASWYDQFREVPAVNPIRPFAESPFRVYRGGSIFFYANQFGASRRSIYEPGVRGGHLGFRVALPVDTIKQRLNDAPTPSIAPSKDPDRRAAEYVLSIGGKIWIGGVPKSAAIWGGSVGREITTIADLPMEPFKLTVVDLQRNTRVTDTGLAIFKDCSNVTILYLFFCKTLTDAGLANFAGCRNMTQLHLQRAAITDDGLAQFKDSTIMTSVYLSDTSITDAGIRYFKNCKDLRQLNLQNTRVTDAGLTEFNNWKSIGHANLSNTRISHLNALSGVPLKFLSIVDTAVTDLTPLKGLELEEIRFTPRNITNGIEIIREIKSLKKIGIRAYFHEVKDVWPSAEFWERYDKGEFNE